MTRYFIKLVSMILSIIGFNMNGIAGEHNRFNKGIMVSCLLEPRHALTSHCL